MANVVEFNHVWKKYTKGEKFNSLRDAIPNFVKSFGPRSSRMELSQKEFWVVKDMSFAIKKGEVVGVMGPNGAGKSTILKLLSGIISPTQGSLNIYGRLSALIEVTAGFHPELTGRENVYLNGTILGMKRKEIDQKFDEIVEFSGVEDFIDTPVKRYSSGMYSRLGFSVAAHMDPEILVVDEVLSVGDISFQAKCAQKMRELMSSGATIILVSHQISLIQSLCKRALLLNQGELIKDASVDEVIPDYQNITFRSNEEHFRRKIKAEEGRVKINQDTKLDITEVIVKGKENIVREEFCVGEHISITIKYQAKQPIESPIVIVDIIRSDGVLCCSLNSKEYGFNMGDIKNNGSVTLDLGCLNLASAVYLLKVAVWEQDMIHPYCVRNRDVIRIKSNTRNSMINAIFIPTVLWQSHEN